MTAGSSAATGDSRQLNSSQSAATSQQRQLNSSQSAAATSQQRQLSSSQSATASSGTTSQQQPAQGQQSTATTQQQSGSKPAQQQPVDNRELSHNQSTKAAQQQPVTTATSVNNFFGPAPMINNHRAEGVCQMQPRQPTTTTTRWRPCSSEQSPQAASGTLMLTVQPSSLLST